MISNPVESCLLEDWTSWQALAREVEPLFGAMADLPEFATAWQNAVAAQQALCVREIPQTPGSALLGGVVFLLEDNEIAWLAVSAYSRGKGVGESLLAQALERLDLARDIRVQTFDASVPEGRPARKLYQRFGFVDRQPGGENPAGYPTVIMIRSVRNTG